MPSFDVTFMFHLNLLGTQSMGHVTEAELDIFIRRDKILHLNFFFFWIRHFHTFYMHTHTYIFFFVGVGIRKKL